MKRAIYFDMDGTLANLYGVEGWLEHLRAGSTKPYEVAPPLLNFQALAHRINSLQRKGYHIGIVSWGSREADDDYLRDIEKAKRRYLEKHLRSVEWDEIKIVPYGIPKHEVVRFPTGILFDDEEQNRKDWCGVAFSEKEISAVLKVLPT